MTKKMVEVKRMTFTEASEKLSGIAGREYHAIKFELTRSPGGCFDNGRDHKTECTLYINGGNHITGADWEEAFMKLENLKADPAPDPMEIAPTGDPTERDEATDDEPDH